MLVVQWRRPDTTKPPEEPNFTLALEEARRGFDQLMSEFHRIRDRAASSLSVGGLSAAFLGGLALRGKDAPLTVWTFLAVVAFVALAATTLYVFWPRSLLSTINPTTLIEWATGDKESGRAPLTLPWQTMFLARQIGRGRLHNQTSVRKMGTAYTIGLVALGLEVIFLLGDLASR